ncbi:MAG: M24 family metallopeptidase [Comamonadaceae bacterium]|nr:MAG: M24 family metallopeptidase [Comamonadaceae bacterium]
MNAPTSLYAERRARLAAQLGAGGIAIVPTAPERSRNRDSDFLFRHDSYFYYLTGFTEPSAWLVLSGDGRSSLFCAPKDLEREIWDGYRLGPEAAPGELGVDEAFSVEELNTRLPKLLENREAVWYPFATHQGLETRIDGWLSGVRARVRFGAQCPQQQRDLCGPLDEMRLVKDAHEQDVMRRAARISADAHVRAMQLSARMLRDGRDVREYHLDAELLHAFRMGGSQYPAYTRTFPADGRFTGPQRALYDLVLASQEAAVAATRAGARFNDPHDATVAVLAQGLLDLGLLQADKVGSAQDVIEQRAYFPFYMHRTGHWLGMDVHDCGSYVEPSEADQISKRRDPLSGETIQSRPSRILRPGMVLTIEPGLYVRPGPDVPERFHHIGIRIEDDAIVTEGGCELITRDVPVGGDEIEALMRG